MAARFEVLLMPLAVGMDCLAFLDLTQVEGWIESGGYLVLFLLLFACGLGLPLPEDIPLIVSGILIAKGKMMWPIAGAVAWLGIIGGDCVLYSLGKKYGLNITKVPFVGKHVSRERIERAEVLFQKYGIWVVAVGRLFAGIRGAMVVAAGATRFSFIKFVIADGLAALVSGGLFVLLGVWFGNNHDLLLEKMKQFKYGLIIFGVVAGVGLIGYIWWRRKSHKTPAQAVLDKAIEKDIIKVDHNPIAESENRPVSEKHDSAG